MSIYRIYSVLRKSKNFTDLSTVGLVKEEHLLPLVCASFCNFPIVSASVFQLIINITLIGHR